MVSADAEPVGRTRLVAGLRGFCAGAIEVCDGPVYVRMVDEFRGRGATFVEESASAPEILVRKVVGYARGSLGVSAVTNSRRSSRT